MRWLEVNYLCQGDYNRISNDLRNLSYFNINFWCVLSLKIVHHLSKHLPQNFFSCIGYIFLKIKQIFFYKCFSTTKKLKTSFEKLKKYLFCFFNLSKRKSNSIHILVILLLHCCYTVVTLLLHYHYTMITVSLHCDYTFATLLQRWEVTKYKYFVTVLQ